MSYWLVSIKYFCILNFVPITYTGEGEGFEELVGEEDLEEKASSTDKNQQSDEAEAEKPKKKKKKRKKFVKFI